MRLFFGFDLAADAKAAIGAWRDRYAVAQGHSVAPANFHITLAFLGDVNNAGLERLCAAVENWREQTTSRAVSLTLDRCGYWPRPGIFWLGSSESSPQLDAMATKLASLGQGVGARRDRRRYIPHVTLYRRCTLPPPASVREPRISVALNDITLFESCRGRRGVSYVPLAVWPL